MAADAADGAVRRISRCLYFVGSLIFRILDDGAAQTAVIFTTTPDALVTAVTDRSRVRPIRKTRFSPPATFRTESQVGVPSHLPHIHPAASFVDPKTWPTQINERSQQSPLDGGLINAADRCLDKRAGRLPSTRGRPDHD